MVLAAYPLLDVETEKAKALLANGAITQTEFEALKGKALA